MTYATVVLTGHYENVDGTPALGWVRITPTARQVIDASGDVILTGDSLLKLVNGAFSVTLPATDDPTLTPSSFGYTVTVGILESTGRASHILGPTTFPLPSNVTSVDMADVTPSDIPPAVVPDAETKLGAQAKADQAEANAKAYTDQEVAALDLSGVVDSVNGKTGAVVLAASDVGADPTGTASGLVGPLDTRVTTLEDAPAAIPASEKGAASGVATLGTDGLVPSSQLPATAVATGVSSVNGQTGDVTLVAADVSAVPTTDKGAANGVATLGADGKVPSAQLPAAATSGGGRDLRWIVPANATSIDEFNDDLMDAAWTRIDGTGALAANLAWSEKGDSLSLTNDGADAAGSYHGLVRPIGSSVAVGDAFVTCLTQMGDPAGVSISGVVASDSNSFGSGAQVAAILWRGTAAPYMVKCALLSITGWNGAATVLYEFYMGTTSSGFVRLVQTAAGTWRADASPDGVSWLKGNAVARAITPTYVGFTDSGAIGSSNPNGRHATSFEFLRRYGGIS